MNGCLQSLNVLSMYQVSLRVHCRDELANDQYTVGDNLKEKSDSIVYKMGADLRSKKAKH